MTNDEARNNDEARITDCHPERSEAQSKDPAELLFGFTTGFLDFARNDGHIRHSIIWSSFDIRPSRFVISFSLASLLRGRLGFPAKNAMASGRHRHSRHSDACADK